ncbi:probable BOI-related E3 ubiquitin-protein ligase 3 [Cajanus cajan]|uniref:BOI-related E3 ubiquitin-protein ligase 3 n=1 Tax=Cajanus cajan TaxID=3821 RepID=A0A151SFE1_CAJCA|nr:probable BOI-related E3 ubiquitin-protein ligase 3 [Cajanus cajan]KYP53554.1 hypothetical protein KK1_024447 [Cajanus cajan]
MAIEAQLYPNNSRFPFSGSKNLMINNIQSCLNSQVYSPKHHQHLHHARQMNPNMSLVDPSFPNSNGQQNVNPFNNYTYNPQTLASYPQGFSVDFDEQREIDHYIRSQNEKLRILLEEQRKQQVEELLRKVELNARYLMRQKDEEIAQATKKTSELNEFLRKLEVENQSWRRVAQENEAMVMSLHNSLEQMKERAVYGVTTEDAESCCDDNMGITAKEEGTGENRVCPGGAVEVEQIRKRTMNCKCCNSQKSCFMFLPCRHLCSCKTCESFLQVCPVCNVPKKSSIETLIL